MEKVSLKGISTESKIELIEELGLKSDGTYVYDEGEKVKDPYIEDDILLNNVLIFPGSCVIIDNNPLSIAAYFEEYGEIF